MLWEIRTNSTGLTVGLSSGRKAKGPEEVMLLHFIGLKRWYHWASYNPAKEYSEFGFSAAGFQPWKTPPTRAVATQLELPN